MKNHTGRKNKQVLIHNIKNPGFRQVHVDGAVGSLTPSGMVNISFFAERMAIPKGIVHFVREDTSLGKKIKDAPESKEGYVREFEFGAYMDITTCRNLRDFLDRRISEYEQFFNQSE